ncbi:hypothetical protein GCM10028813_12270 [Ramlibacter alkalitolerans]
MYESSRDAAWPLRRTRMGQSVSATVPRRGWDPLPLMAARPRLLLDVAEPDCPILVLYRAAVGSRPLSTAAWIAGGELERSRDARSRTPQDQPGTVRLCDIKEEARAGPLHG